MRIRINEIQPIERYLARETVEYYLKNPGKIRKSKPRINISHCSGQPFRFIAEDGNCRLYVLNRIGAKLIELPESLVEKAEDANLALENYNSGLRSWSDFDEPFKGFPSRIILEKERSRIYEALFDIPKNLDELLIWLR